MLMEINFKYRFRETAAVCSNFLARSYSVSVVANNSIIFALLIRHAGGWNNFPRELTNLRALRQNHLALQSKECRQFGTYFALKAEQIKIPIQQP
jgi:hypothetical protein